MKPSLLRSYLLISLGITALFILIGFFAIELIDQMNRKKFESNPPMFFTQMVDNADKDERTKIFEEMKSEHFPFNTWVIDRKGNIENHSTGKPLPLDVSTVKLPDEEMTVTNIERSFWSHEPSIMILKLHGSPEKFLVFEPRWLPSPLFGLFHAGPLGPRHDGQMPPPPPPNMLVGGPHNGPPPNAGSPSPGQGPRSPMPFLWPIFIFIAAILLSSAVSAGILFMYLKKTSIVADSVLDAIKRGDLKARFPKTKMNEIGNLMNRFNQMADQVENLFEQLKNKERLRTRLLQDLAHDLRTPITSMQNNLSLISGEQGRIAEEAKTELVTISQKEASYLERLVNDLLLLSQITEPELFSSKVAKVDIAELITTEIETLNPQNSKIKLINHMQDESKIIMGDAHLLKRLFRNLLDNAISFARSEVEILVTESFGQIAITVKDNGAGFSPEALKNYGERRTTRIIESKSKEGRISVGLGSVIVKAIAQIHGAEVVPHNSSGAAVTVTFKI